MDSRTATLLVLAAAIGSGLSGAAFASDAGHQDQAKPVMGDPAPPEPAEPAEPATPAPADSVKVTWADLDADGDGKLSATEAAGIERLGDGFGDADADGDGLLTAAEYNDWREQQPTGDRSHR